MPVPASGQVELEVGAAGVLLAADLCAEPEVRPRWVRFEQDRRRDGNGRLDLQVAQIA